eukprot:1181713-Prorocentrum_minimum.AAC.2
MSVLSPGVLGLLKDQRDAQGHALIGNPPYCQPPVVTALRVAIRGVVKIRAPVSTPGIFSLDMRNWLTPQVYSLSTCAINSHLEVATDDKVASPSSSRYSRGA